VILPVEAWMDIRRYAPLRAAGASWKDIAAQAGCDWRTAKKYLSPDAPAVPLRATSRAGTVPRLVDPFTEVIDAWLADDPRLRATVIHERLVADYGFTGHYQRIKVYCAEARRRIELESDTQGRPPGLHRRFEVVAGAQAQVDWGDEGCLLVGAGAGKKVYSFHMTLSYSRDPFICFTTSQDLATFFDCHRRAFAHFGGYVGVEPPVWCCGRAGWAFPSRSARGLAAEVGTKCRRRRESCGVVGACTGGRLPGVRRRAVPTQHVAGHGL
jgi:transposase